MSEKVINTHNQHDVERAEGFYLKAFNTMSGDGGVGAKNFRDALRQHYIDEFGSDTQLSVRQIDNQIRILGANFFRIIGVEQPRTAGKYRQIITNFTDIHPQPDIDKN